MRHMQLKAEKFRLPLKLYGIVVDRGTRYRHAKSLVVRNPVVPEFQAGCNQPEIEWATKLCFIKERWGGHRQEIRRA